MLSGFNVYVLNQFYYYYVAKSIPLAFPQALVSDPTRDQTRHPSTLVVEILCERHPFLPCSFPH
uniref:Uncharacterized protein n=1 Tax=Ciona intestinalis TaxID=7719 RepID=H2XVD8_CIOIN